MSKTMQDKETKERKEMIKRLLKQLEYYYSDNEKHTRCPLCGLDFSKFDEELDRIEQEAERRERKTILTEIIGFANSEVALISAFSPMSEKIKGEQTGEIRAYSNIVSKLQPYLAELKLLEEENER